MPTAPTITSLSSTQAVPGDPITIIGENFGAQQGSGYVHFADNGVNWGEPGNAAVFQLLSWGNTQIVFIVPVKDANGWQTTPGTTATVTVTNSGGQTSNAKTIALSVTPTITGLNVTSAAPGATIVITGKNFGPVQSTGYVHFADNLVNWGEPGNQAQFDLLSWADTQISFILPVKDSNGWQTTPGSTATVSVVNSDGLTSNSVSLTVTTGVNFPVQITSPVANIGGTGDGHMQTSITITSAGALTGTTHTWDTSGWGPLTGFHGGVAVVLFGPGNAQLASFGFGPYGVEGGQSRNDSLSGTIAASVLDQLMSVAVMDFYDPQYSAAGSVWNWIAANQTTLIAIATAVATIAA
jgi:hypothetical protein